MSEAANKRGEYGNKPAQLDTGWGALIGLGALGVGAILLVRHEARDYETRMKGFTSRPPVDGFRVK
jgi:hypothetical protein